MYFIRFLVLIVLLLNCVDSAPGSYYYQHWCGSDLVYLDDAKCQKQFPANYNRSFSCPTLYSNLGGFNTEMPPNQIEFDTTLLQGKIPDEAYVAVILVRRDKNGTPYYKYFGNGNHLVPHETWSSSKVFAASNGGVQLSQSCDASAGLVSHVSGIPLGDLITIICSYDTTQGYTSNELGYYFTSFGGIQHGTKLIQDWLQRPNETLGGSYGAQLNKSLALGFTFQNPPVTPCTLPQDTSAHIPNTLSAFTAAEFIKRIVMHREETEPYQVPGFGWETDASQILYGPENSVYFPDQVWGGMSADTAIYIQSSVDIETVKKVSQGNWRIFSKLGFGFTSIRQRLELVSNGYACFPVLDNNGNPVENQGLEFIIAASYFNDQNDGEKLDNDVHSIFQAIIQALQTVP